MLTPILLLALTVFISMFFNGAQLIKRGHLKTELRELEEEIEKLKKEKTEVY